MLSRPIQRLIEHHEVITENFFRSSANRIKALFSTSSSRLAEYIELPRRRRGSERKPLATPINELKRRARVERKMRREVREFTLRPPENGLLVKSLIPVAHEVFDARKVLFACVLRVMESIPIHVCRVCGEVHVGMVPYRIRSCDVVGSLSTKDHSWAKGGMEHVLPLVESFHLYDRLGRAVSHEERLEVDRIPAIVELCVQAGVDIPEYPTKRRAFPVYNIGGKMIDFEKKFPRDYSSGKDIQPFGFWQWKKKPGDSDSPSFSSNDSIQDIAVQGMDAWEKMRSGALKLVKKYPVQTCGFCPEVQVGPKGHRARICQAYKHQMRDGQHAWQEATVDDLVPPVYVWHVPDPDDGNPLMHELRRYYGKLPAVVELFAQAGAIVGKDYYGLMRKDVALPALDEESLVV
ncbi:APO protein 3, mitochondrial [Elaeis guineensis]|uniref:APO protein 3, mitochondrial n=1 Tax=Elaeis guineensis var. tenera TaxID=51953 RepID=A0A6I9S8Q1_ELAGV|nr:APO protein 3, mitochondrial [Elaeis guineensis]XP_010935258.1 APO protein 3, mitochondrial [Elaeis guineensis]